MSHLATVMPKNAVSFLGKSLTRTTPAHSGGVALIIIGGVMALWALSGAMQTVMWALNIAYDKAETRNFVKKRLVALAMIIRAVISFALVFVLLILGPHMPTWVGSALGNTTLVTWVWWIAQWPILLLAPLTTFAIVVDLAPNVVPRRWQPIIPRRAARGHRRAGRLGPLRRLHQPVRVIHKT